MARESLEKRFLRSNCEIFSDAEILELLLRHTSVDSHELAQTLLRQYPTIADLLEVRFEDLRHIEGMDDDSAGILRLVPELQRRYFLSRTRADSRLLDSSAYGRYLLPHFMGRRDETVFLLMLDAACNVLNCKMLGEGSVNSANVPIRKLVHEAINANATGLVLAHNHPSGIAIPSPEDVEITLRLREALEIMELHLLDHLIFADDDFVSLRESGYL